MAVALVRVMPVDLMQTVDLTALAVIYFVKGTIFTKTISRVPVTTRELIKAFALVQLHLNSYKLVLQLKDATMAVVQHTLVLPTTKRNAGEVIYIGMTRAATNKDLFSNVQIIAKIIIAKAN